MILTSDNDTVTFRRDTVNVFFHILTACNLRCRHCYINPDQHGSQSLPFRTIRSWLGLFQTRASRANLVFLGGEPTLHPNLAEAVTAARQIGFRTITVDTNGFLFHDFLSKVAPNDLEYISFSLDGATKNLNDGLRGEGSFDACLAGMRKALDSGFHTSLIYTVSSENIHELERMPDLISALDVSRFFIQVVGIRGKPAQHGASIHQVSVSEWRAVVPDVAREVAGRGVSVVYPKVFLRPGEPFECAGLVADNYFIFPNGRVYRCPLCEDYPLHGLEIRDNQLVERPGINERNLFPLRIPEGCVMNRLVQPNNLVYSGDGEPLYRIACCLLKEEIGAGG